MINRYFKQGQKLDVAGLNEITVLIDRSETELSEIGWNCWTPNQDGPPHKHDDKTQLFYVTDGVGKIKLGDEVYDAAAGDLAYVPAGLVHQTITTTNEKLCYMLFVVFNDPKKEGHTTFADHIEKVKQIRKMQAISGISDVVAEEKTGPVKPGKFISGIVKESPASLLSSSELLIEREQDTNLELFLVRRPAGLKKDFELHEEKEQTFFVIEGNGTVIIGNESEEVKPGNVIFVPRNVKHNVYAGSQGILYLCLNSYPVI